LTYPTIPRQEESTHSRSL